ncbi:hypothetical protein ACX0G9_14170 [Flavitalea flava]
MSNIEPDIQDFLKKIVSSIFLSLIWMMVNMTLGIYFGLFFPDGKFGIGNLLFYIFLLGTFFFLLRFLYRTWKKKFPHG